MCGVGMEGGGGSIRRLIQQAVRLTSSTCICLFHKCLVTKTVFWGHPQCFVGGAKWRSDNHKINDSSERVQQISLLPLSGVVFFFLFTFSEDFFTIYLMVFKSSGFLPLSEMPAGIAIPGVGLRRAHKEKM